MQESTTSTIDISQIPNKILDSSDDDGDDKSIQLLNDDEQTETELLLNKNPIMQRSLIPSELLKAEPTTSMEQSKCVFETTMTSENGESVIKEDCKENLDEDDDDDIDVYEKATANSKSSNSSENLKNEEQALDEEKMPIMEEVPDAEKAQIVEEVPDVEKAQSAENLSIGEMVPVVEDKPIETVVEKKLDLTPKKTKVPALSKGLFDDSDDEDDENDELFSLSKSSAVKTAKPDE